MSVEIFSPIVIQSTNDLWTIDNERLVEVLKNNFQLNSRYSKEEKEELLQSLPNKIPKHFNGKRIRKKVQELQKLK